MSFPLLVALAAAAVAGPCSAENLARERVLDLRPTQIAVGMIEVGERVKHLEGLKPSELKDYLDKNPIPVIMAPQGRLYIIDHHHLARAAWELGVKRLPVEQKGDLSHLSLPAFWDAMKKSHWVYPYDQYGAGPHDTALLPVDVRGLADDPYRSLSWKVRREGGYDKTPIPFAEFQWADFFRKSLTIGSLNDNFDEAVKEALELSKSPLAKDLPGYRGPAAAP